MFLMPGDFFHSNEIFPWRMNSYSRHRIYIKGPNVVRYEITDDIYKYFTDKDTWNTHFEHGFTNPQHLRSKI